MAGVAKALNVSLNKLSVVVNVVLRQVKLGSVHLAHGLHCDLLEELVEPAVLILLNGGEGEDSVASYVHFYAKGSVGSARPAQHSFTLLVINVFSQFHLN